MCMSKCMACFAWGKGLKRLVYVECIVYSIRAYTRFRSERTRDSRDRMHAPKPRMLRYQDHPTQVGNLCRSVLFLLQDVVLFDNVWYDLKIE